MTERKEDTSYNDPVYEDYKFTSYKELRDGQVKVKFSDKIVKCPYCPESREYPSMDDLLSHASRIARESKSSTLKEKAKHKGLFDFLERNIDTKIKIPESTSKSKNIDLDENDMSIQKNREELIVWPWMVVVANIPVRRNYGRYTGDSGKKLKDEWIQMGYNPIKVNTLWSKQGHSGFAIVEFGSDMGGFANAMMFEKDFEVNKHGRKDWYDGSKSRDGNLYAWIARDDDYNSIGLIGDHIRKNGDLKTVSQVEKENEVKNSKLVMVLKSMVDEKNKRSEEMESEISKTDQRMASVMKQKEQMIENFNRDVKLMQDEANKQLQQITIEHEQSKLQLEEREKELRTREALNESEQKKLDIEKEKNKMAILEQKKADERMLKLADDHKIEQMKGAMEVMSHMTHEDVEAQQKVESMKEEIQEKEEELEALEDLNQTLVIKERLTNNEVQDARKELINGLKNGGNASIRVKRMGELDAKPFIDAAKRRGLTQKKAANAIKCASLWEDHLRDPNWHPFKVITIGDECKEVLNEEDEKIVSLKEECDEGVYEAVVTALKELNEYNPSGRYPLAEL